MFWLLVATTPGFAQTIFLLEEAYRIGLGSARESTYSTNRSACKVYVKTLGGESAFST